MGVGWEPSLLTQGRGKDGMKMENWEREFWRNVHDELLFIKKFFPVVIKTESLKNDILKEILKTMFSSFERGDVCE